MIKLSVVIKKQTNGKLDTLYIGEDNTKAIKVYRESDGEMYLFSRCKHDRCKNSPEEVKPKLIKKPL